MSVPGEKRNFSHPLAAAKQNLRRIIGKKRRELPHDERLDLSKSIQHHVLQSDIWASHRTVALYCPIRGEADTTLLMEAAWNEKKQLLLPVCSKDEPGKMDFCRCHDKNSLIPGSYGIFEPDPDLLGSLRHAPCPFEGREEILVIVPGLAFDRKGMRLGQGGGYYDRFFAIKRDCSVFLLGLAYSFQLVDELPHSEQDQPINALATENGMLFF